MTLRSLADNYNFNMKTIYLSLKNIILYRRQHNINPNKTLEIFKCVKGQDCDTIHGVLTSIILHSIGLRISEEPINSKIYLTKEQKRIKVMVEDQGYTVGLL